MYFNSHFLIIGGTRKPTRVCSCSHHGQTLCAKQSSVAMNVTALNNAILKQVSLHTKLLLYIRTLKTFSMYTFLLASLCKLFLVSNFSFVFLLLSLLGQIKYIVVNSSLIALLGYHIKE